VLSWPFGSSWNRAPWVPLAIGLQGRKHNDREDRLGGGRPLVSAVVWGTFVAPQAPVDLPGALVVVLQALVFGSAASPCSRACRYRASHLSSGVRGGRRDQRRTDVRLAAVRYFPTAKLIRRSAWKDNSANFAFTEFSEVGAEVRLGASCLWWRGRYPAGTEAVLSCRCPHQGKESS
jgi:hypothetical protein